MFADPVYNRLVAVATVVVVATIIVATVVPPAIISPTVIVPPAVIAAPIAVALSGDDLLLQILHAALQVVALVPVETVARVLLLAVDQLAQLVT